MKPITFSHQQVALMCRFAGIDDPTLKLESPDSPSTQRFFNLKPDGKGDFVWIPR